MKEILLDHETFQIIAKVHLENRDFIPISDVGAIFIYPNGYAFACENANYDGEPHSILVYRDKSKMKITYLVGMPHDVPPSEILQAIEDRFKYAHNSVIVERQE